MEARRLGRGILRRLRSRWGRFVEGPEPVAGPASAKGEEPAWVLEPSFPLECTEAEADRWDAEWLRYLAREWRTQFEPYSSYPSRPDLPEDPTALIDLGLGFGPPLELYCDREWLLDADVMEMGSGCGNLGKLLGRFARSYLGVDYSRLALRVARLVSPENCSYVHVADRAALEPHFGNKDTAVGRYFWIHQNMKLARQNLDYLALFLRPGGRLYADFYWPSLDRPQGVVLDPEAPLSARHPSCTFRYAHEDVERLIRDRPFRLVREEIHARMQRRYVVLERTR